MALTDDEETPMPNGNGATSPFDPETANLPEIAGFVLAMDSEVRRQGQVQAVQVKLITKIAMALGIQPDKSEPPPPFRSMLDSQNSEIKALQEADVVTTGQMKAVSADLADAKTKVEDAQKKIAETEKDVAQTKVIIRLGLIEGIPKVIKVGIGLTGAIAALTLLASQIWAAVRGH